MFTGVGDHPLLVVTGGITLVPIGEMGVHPMVIIVIIECIPHNGVPPDLFAVLPPIPPVICVPMRNITMPSIEIMPDLMRHHEHSPIDRQVDLLTQTKCIVR